MNRIARALNWLEDDEIADIALAIVRMFNAEKPLTEVIQALRNGEVKW